MARRNITVTHLPAGRETVRSLRSKTTDSRHKTMQTDIPMTVLSNGLFERLSRFISAECGIKMPASKKTMLEARLMKRLRALGMTSFGEYGAYLFSPEGLAHELVPMIDMVTTNKTDFFREPRHFDLLVARVLPDLVRRTGAGMHRPLKIWSAACSTGEEPYTLAMVLDDFTRRQSGFTYQVLGTDISTQVLDKARRGIYDDDRAAPIPARLKTRCLMRSRDRDKKLVRIAPELRAKVSFKRLNFMEHDFGLREKMDIIFCRNVLIYFDRPTQERVIRRLCDHLVSGGYLFTGHAETISGLGAPLAPVANTISRKL